MLFGFRVLRLNESQRNTNHSRNPRIFTRRTVKFHNLTFSRSSRHGPLRSVSLRYADRSQARKRRNDDLSFVRSRVFDARLLGVQSVCGLLSRRQQKRLASCTDPDWPSGSLSILPARIESRRYLQDLREERILTDQSPKDTDRRRFVTDLFFPSPSPRGSDLLASRRNLDMNPPLPPNKVKTQ